MGGVVSNSLQFSATEWAYLCYHRGWRMPNLRQADDLPRFVAICNAETQITSGTYRPESENPGGGIDMGASQINSKYHPIPDPFVRFDPITNIDHALAIYKKSGLAPWGYPTPRGDASLNTAAFIAEIGVNPYDISKSPYWRMRKMLINTWDLPVPPSETWVSTLPTAPLRYGQGAAPPSPVGIQINILQRTLRDLGRFSGGLDYYYGPRVQTGVASIQRDLAASNLWTGPVDGREYSVLLRTAWDGALEMNFLLNRGTL